MDAQRWRKAREAFEALIELDREARIELIKGNFELAISLLEPMLHKYLQLVGAINRDTADCATMLAEALQRSGQQEAAITAVESAVFALRDTTRVEFRTDGTVFKSGGGTAWDQISDARLKRDVQPLEGALDQLLQLRGVRFAYNVPALNNGIELPQGEQVGFLAQEVREVFPDWVNEDREGVLSVGERGSTALLVEALRELHLRNAALEARIAALEGAASKRN